MKLLIKLFLTFLLLPTFAQLARAQAPVCEPVTERLGIAIDSHVNNQKCVGVQIGYSIPVPRNGNALGIQYDLMVGVGNGRELDVTFVGVGSNLDRALLSYRLPIAQASGIQFGAVLQGGYDVPAHGGLLGGFAVVDYASEKTKTQLTANVGVLGDTAKAAYSRTQVYAVGNIGQAVGPVTLYATAARYVNIGAKPSAAYGGGVGRQMGPFIFDLSLIRSARQNYLVAGVAVSINKLLSRK